VVNNQDALPGLARHSLIYGSLLCVLIRHAVFGVNAVGAGEKLVGE